MLHIRATVYAVVVARDRRSWDRLTDFVLTSLWKNSDYRSQLCTSIWSLTIPSHSSSACKVLSGQYSVRVLRFRRSTMQHVHVRIGYHLLRVRTRRYRIFDAGLSRGWARKSCCASHDFARFPQSMTTAGDVDGGVPLFPPRCKRHTPTRRSTGVDKLVDCGNV